MKFKIFVSDGGESWEESYDESKLTTSNAVEKWAEDTIAWFNEGLRPGERPRVLERYEILSESVSGPHKWVKQNIYTQVSPQGSFDLMKCEKCGALARRYGLANFKMQKGFTTKKFKTCPAWNANTEIKA